ncbi:AAA family ATPase [Actinocorallia sp. B10E7]|uniref:AAA family ATPase n=1 Tax=Actinocorallia sp. B10E7 TaxID=3153558 RepID=UPI00325C4D48
MTAEQRLPGWPTFVRELDGTLAVASQYILHGDTRDMFRIPADADRPAMLVSLQDLIWRALRVSGYRCLIRYDLVDGISVYPETAEARAEAQRILGVRGLPEGCISLENLCGYLQSVACPRTPLDPEAEGGEPLPPGALPLYPRVAFLLDYASRIPRSLSGLDAAERDFFLFCQKLADTAESVYARGGARPYSIFNPLIWLVDGDRDLPAWFTGGSERIRVIGLPRMELDERREVAEVLARRFGKRRQEYSESDKKVIEEFVHATDGMGAFAMSEITRLAQDRGTGFAGLSEATRIYKLGISDDPWASPGLRGRLVKEVERPPSSFSEETHDERSLYDRVIGQDMAVDKTLDILIRAATGLSGAHKTAKGSRPRGVLFFAGPTGVGKTELAKAVSKLLFGDNESYLRFDMSEFSAAHAADRLVGAPPGYVGFEAGGELTSAIRNRPFRVVLFDEIEKAHPSVLDKFLQILEDGRLTDGRGITTHFSECVLIFTSNLGIITTDPKTNMKSHVVRAEQNLGYDELSARILEAIRQEFVMNIGRPELLNRFGDNFVIFDFISAETADKIFQTLVANTIHTIETGLGIHLRIAPTAGEDLRAHCTKDRENGGRGIGNALETVFINPLSRELLIGGYRRGTTLTVVEAQTGLGRPALVVKPGGER